MGNKDIIIDNPSLETRYIYGKSKCSKCKKTLVGETRFIPINHDNIQRYTTSVVTTMLGVFVSLVTIVYIS